MWRLQFLRGQVGFLWAYVRARGVTWKTPRMAARLVRPACRVLGPIRGQALDIADQPLDCTAVLLSHKRPSNIEYLVRVCLAQPWVTRVVVSNSNTAVDITRWVRVCDARLALINEPARTGVGYRFVLAAESGTDFCVSIDDDVFLDGPQLSAVFAHLVAEPSRVHGIIGHNLASGGAAAPGIGFFVTQIMRQEADVDTLIGTYAFTRQHARRYLELCRLMGITDPKMLDNGEDVILSQCGDGKPRVHDVGRIVECISSLVPGVALCLTLDNFWPARAARLLEARRLRQEVA
jgi:hypothetical protein